VLQTQSEALAAVFPGAAVERKTAFLSEDQASGVEIAARAQLQARMIPYYVAVSSTATVGYAYFDTHLVRTMPETLMVVVAPDGKVKAVEVLAFHEPEDYLPRPRWRKEFEGKTLEDPLWIKRDLRNVTGATLTARAVAEAVRRVLAIHKAVHP